MSVEWLCKLYGRKDDDINVTNIRQPNWLKMISTMQLKKCLTCNEPTFMAIPLESLENPKKIVPKDIMCVLEKYSDVLSDSLSKSLPSRRMTDHKIELLLGAKLPTKNAYHLAPLKLTEL
ncbi:RNA-directed DNA polymerase-like protein [Cucumis melo var. makuwa]|nr:RNA-directed DNA polymerase-like protein [Cucumis melo var. makuwa]